MTGRVLTTGRFCCNFAAKLNNKTISIMKREKTIYSVMNAMSKQLTVVAMVAGLTVTSACVAKGTGKSTESTEKTEDTERRVILEGPGSLESLESPKAVLIPKTPEIPETIARAENQVYECVEEMPSFPGGMKALEKFLNDSIRYPAETCAQGRVIVQFIVEVDGRIDSVKVVRKLSPELDREAVRVVKLMPKWNPGRMNGVPVRVKYIIPVRFNAKQ